MADEKTYRKENTFCKSCQEDVQVEFCERCNKDIKGACLDCHNETVHKIIKDQNIHIIGGTPSKFDRIDEDTDAYGRSDRYGN